MITVIIKVEIVEINVEVVYKLRNTYTYAVKAKYRMFTWTTFIDPMFVLDLNKALFWFVVSGH